MERGVGQAKQLAFPEPALPGKSLGWPQKGRDKRARGGLLGISLLQRTRKVSNLHLENRLLGHTELSKPGSRFHLPKRSLLIPTVHEKARRAPVTSNRSFN